MIRINFQVFKWIADHGVTNDKNYPYKEHDSISCPVNLAGRSNRRVAGGVFLPSSDEESLRRVLATYGPVAVAVYASTQKFSDYRSGK